MKIHLTIIFLLITPFLFAQVNLVPNPSFEVYDTCPCGYNEIHYAIPWYNADIYTFVEYLNACNLSGTMDVPENIYGYQNAHTGVAYAGIWGYKANIINSDRWYIGVELTDSLIEEKKYCISFYVSLADSCKYAITRIGAYLSDTIILKTSGSPHGPFPFTPQIVSPPGVFLPDTTNWILISGEYIASGGEKFITIGNYNDNANTDTTSTGVNTIIFNGAFYYLDDVSVTLCDSVVVIENTDNAIGNLIIYPNPATNELNLDCALTDKSYFELYDLIGAKRKAVTLDCGSQTKRIDLTDIDSGLYFYSVVDRKGNRIKTGKLIVIK